MSTLENSFGAWLKVVLPDSGIAERDQRLSIVRQYAATATKADVMGLVHAFYSAGTSQPIVVRLRSAMLNVDTSFGVKDNAELAVIAAGVLFEILERGGDLGSAVALALLCADFGALSETNHITEIVAKAETFNKSEGIRIREEEIKLLPLGASLHSALEPVQEEESEEDEDAETEDEEEADDEAETEDEQCNQSLKRVVSALANYGQEVQKAVDLIESRRAEQSDILYWLLSGRREIAGVPLRNLNKVQAAIFVATELAKLTRQIPGPASSRAILSTLLEQCQDVDTDEVALKECVSSIEPMDGAAHLTKRTVVQPLITPLSFALTKAEENGWATGWENAFKTQTHQSADAKYSVLTIAEQIYREALLSRVLGEE